MTASLRIAVVGACAYPVPQGSQVYLRETARALQNAGHEPQLVVYGYGIGEDTSELPLHRCASVPFARKTRAGPALGKPLLDVALARTLRKLCREYDADAVSAHNYEGLLVALVARCRPILYHAHNAMKDELPAYFGGAAWAKRFGAWLDATLPRRADACIVPHDRLRDYLIDCGCDAERVHTVAPAIDSLFAERLSEPTPAPTVLYTGNLDPYQNLQLLAEAIRTVEIAIPDVRLKLVSADSVVGTPLDTLNRVESVPNSDPASLQIALAEDAVFACPRISWSGYPMKLLNAMNAGRAIVCCASSAHPLTNEHDALIVPDNDAEGFAGAIERLLENAELRNRLGRAARDTHARHHTTEAFSRALNELYAHVVAAPKV